MARRVAIRVCRDRLDAEAWRLDKSTAQRRSADPGPPRAATGDHVAMPSREFEDRLGVRWSVWEVRPASTSELVDALGNPRVRPEFMEGWLAFECDAEQRRYAPVPPEWERFEDFRLERLCALGELVERSRRPIE